MRIMWTLIVGSLLACGESMPSVDAAADTGCDDCSDAGADAGTDTGPGDTGPGDTGPSDTGPRDSGRRDTGPEDASADTNPDTDVGDAGADSDVGDAGADGGDAGCVDCSSLDDDCSVGVCDSGTCVRSPRAAGTPCGAGLTETICNPDVCDGAGTCTDVAAASDGTACGGAIAEPVCNPDACDDSGMCVDRGPPAVPRASGCASCTCPVANWPIAWEPQPCATRYIVRFRCSSNPEQMVTFPSSVTSVADVCDELGLCADGMCAFTVGYIHVQACTDTECADPIDVPNIPSTCGGGTCCN